MTTIGDARVTTIAGSAGRGSAFALALLLIAAAVVGTWPVGGAGPAAAEAPIAVIVDGRPIAADVAPVVREGRVFLPLRALCEALGAQVDWDGATGTVTVARAGSVIVLRVGQSQAQVNGQPRSLDAAPFLEQGRTMLPLRFAAEALGAEVAWDAAARTVRVTTQVAYRLHGLNFSPYLAGQDPNLGAVISEGQLRQRMAVIAPYTEWVRTFGCTHGLERAGAVAHALGLKIAMGAWLSRDGAANEREIANLIAAAKAGEADLAVVGSEALLRGDLTEDQLCAYIDRVARAVPEVPVTYGDVYGMLLGHPRVLRDVDVVFANYYPYWEGMPLDAAMAALDLMHAQVVRAAAGKPVVVSETGWPSDGNAVGDAAPSPEAAAFYFLEFVSWARARDVDYFYFAAFDEAWKAAPEGPQGASWGVWDEDGHLKPGMQRVFAGETLPDTWTAAGPIGGPGEPAIEFTFVPAYGSFELLRGQAAHVLPDEYAVAVYIRVDGGWWTKPYWDQPLTLIRPDGSFTCDITTGGIDQEATRIAAYLVPRDYDPPLMAGGASLPAALEHAAVAVVEARRSP